MAPRQTANGNNKLRDYQIKESLDQGDKNEAEIMQLRRDTNKLISDQNKRISDLEDYKKTREAIEAEKDKDSGGGSLLTGKQAGAIALAALAIASGAIAFATKLVGAE